MADNITIEGGCFCGDIRYRATEPPLRPGGACLCKNCRHAATATFVSFVAFGTDNLETDRFRFIKGEPVRYRYTSEMVIREGDDTDLPVGHALWSEWWFCGRCGTTLVHIHEGLTGSEGNIQELGVTTCTLDDPNAFPPEKLEGEDEMLSWIELWSLDDRQLCLAVPNIVRSHAKPSKTWTQRE